MKRRHEDLTSSKPPPLVEAAVMNARQYPPWLSLSMDLLAESMTYCDAVDLLALRRTCGAFRRAARLAVSRAEVLHLSVLHKTNAEEQRQYQEACVASLLEDAGTSLQTLEMTGLESIRGNIWLNGILHRCQNLTSLSLRGCVRLDPHRLQSAIESSRANLIHLDLSNCRRVDKSVVQAILDKWRDLETLQLGGCSGTIDDDCFLSLSRNLRKLRAIDLSHLRRLGERTSDREVHVLSLAASLECINLSYCWELCLPVLGEISQQLEPLFARRLEEGTMSSLVNLVSAGNMDEVWSILEPDMSVHSRELLARNRFSSMDTFLTSSWKNLRSLKLFQCDIPKGVLSFLSLFSGGSLRDVDVSWCKDVTDEDIKVLAATCANSLTSLEVYGCNIGDSALVALGTECKNLSYLDVSECFDITNEGILSLCPTNGHFISKDGSEQHLAENRGCPRLRSLKLSYLQNMTNDAILAIGGLAYDSENDTVYQSEGGMKKLLLLDVCGCPNVSSWAIQRTMVECPSLIELVARGINGNISLNQAPSTLCFLDGQRLNCAGHRGASTPRGCCSVMTDSQERIKPQPWFYCIDCKLLPSDFRGMCSVCADVCHKDHRTFLGSVCRFVCDCAYGIAGGEDCKALSPSEATT